MPISLNTRFYWIIQAHDEVPMHKSGYEDMDFRYSVGVSFTSFLNTRLKVALLLNPQSKAKPTKESSLLQPLFELVNAVGIDEVVKVFTKTRIDNFGNLGTVHIQPIGKLG